MKLLLFLFAIFAIEAAHSLLKPSTRSSGLSSFGVRSDRNNPVKFVSVENLRDEEKDSAQTKLSKRSILSLRPLIKKTMGLFISDRDVLNLVSTVLAGSVWTIIILSFIASFGLDTKPFISLMAISGFTFGFAIKDILTSTIAAAHMISMRPFKRDMVISIGSHEGRVKSFDTNFVKLINRSNQLVLLPMSSVYGQPIVIHRQPGQQDQESFSIH